MEPPTSGDEVKPEDLEEAKESGPLYHCDLFDSEVVHKIAQALLPGLASACVDNTTGGLRSAASVAVDIRREMVDYLLKRSETFVAESVVLDGGPDGEVSHHPFDIVSDFIDDFASSKRNFFSKVSGWLLSERREDRIDDFVQEIELDGFWLLARREAVAQTLLKNVDFKNKFHCSISFKSLEELDEHGRHCKFKTVNCTNEGCNAIFSAAHREEHDSICPFKLLPCEQKCSDSILRREMDKHCITICPMKLVNCHFYSVGCQSTVPQCKMNQHCVDNLQSHLLYALQALYKEASESDLKIRVEKIVKLSSAPQLAAIRDARSLAYTVKDLDAKLGPIEETNTKSKPIEEDRKVFGEKEGRSSTSSDDSQEYIVRKEKSASPEQVAAFRDLRSSKGSGKPLTELVTLIETKTISKPSEKESIDKRGLQVSSTAIKQNDESIDGRESSSSSTSSEENLECVDKKEKPASLELPAASPDPGSLGYTGKGLDAKKLGAIYQTSTKSKSSEGDQESNHEKESSSSSTSSEENQESFDNKESSASPKQLAAFPDPRSSAYASEDLRTSNEISTKFNFSEDDRESINGRGSVSSTSSGENQQPPDKKGNSATPEQLVASQDLGFSVYTGKDLDARHGALDKTNTNSRSSEVDRESINGRGSASSTSSEENLEPVDKKENSASPVQLAASPDPGFTVYAGKDVDVQLGALEKTDTKSKSSDEDRESIDERESASSTSSEEKQESVDKKENSASPQLLAASQDPKFSVYAGKDLDAKLRAVDETDTKSKSSDEDKESIGERESLASSASEENQECADIKESSASTEQLAASPDHSSPAYAGEDLDAKFGTLDETDTKSKSSDEDQESIGERESLASSTSSEENQESADKKESTATAEQLAAFPGTGLSAYASQDLNVELGTSAETKTKPEPSEENQEPKDQRESLVSLIAIKENQESIDKSSASLEKSGASPDPRFSVYAGKDLDSKLGVLDETYAKSKSSDKDQESNSERESNASSSASEENQESGDKKEISAFTDLLAASPDPRSSVDVALGTLAETKTSLPNEEDQESIDKRESITSFTIKVNHESIDKCSASLEQPTASPFPGSLTYAGKDLDAKLGALDETDSKSKSREEDRESIDGRGSHASSASGEESDNKKENLASPKQLSASPDPGTTLYAAKDLDANLGALHEIDTKSKASEEDQDLVGEREGSALSASCEDNQESGDEEEGSTSPKEVASPDSGSSTIAGKDAEAELGALEETDTKSNASEEEPLEETDTKSNASEEDQSAEERESHASSASGEEDQESDNEEENSDSP